MKSTHPSFLLLGLLFSLNLTAQQQNLDSLRAVYNTLGEDTLKVEILGDLFNATINRDMQTAQAYAKERLQLAKKLNYRKGTADAHDDVGNYFKYTGKVDSARFHFRKALDIYKEYDNLKGEVMITYALATLELGEGNHEKALELSDQNLAKREQMGDSLGLGIEYNFRAGIFEQKGSFKIAYDNILKALAIYDKIDEPLRKADALNGLGSLEASFLNFEKANEYGLEALKIYREQDDTLYEAVSCNVVGQSYMSLNDFANAEKYLLEAIALSKQLNIKLLEGGATRNLGRNYVKQKRYVEGIEALEQAVTIHRQTPRPIALVRSLYFLASAYNETGQRQKALDVLNESEILAKSSKFAAMLGDIYGERSKALEAQSDYKTALADVREFKRLNDSIFNSDKTKQIEELRTIYETEKKEQQIVLQKNEIDLLEQKAEISNLQRILMGAALVLSLLGFYALRQKMKRNRLEREKVDAELAFKKKELTTHALHLAKKNEVLESVKQKAKELKLAENQPGYQQLIQTINFDQQDDRNWENFTQYFEQVHKDFASNVKSKYPEVTKNELRFMALMKMNMSSKEIAAILNISTDGIKKARQRLRKKMDLSPEDSLENTVLTI
ncbi:tetratricopeptide repeat protein [Flavobacteriaceae bacterium 3-367]|uniref:tetratricopeptide repeat protein n=1 Tax=Eudoraea algarum TaxID=3417568 RepID=UPI003295D1AD